MKKLILCCLLFVAVLCVPTSHAQWISGPRVYMQIKDKVYAVTLEDTPPAQELLQRLPMTVHMTEKDGKEKYHYLLQPLSTLPENVGYIESGDILLWNNDCLVIFYEKVYTSDAYTRIGRIENPADLAIMLGHDDVNVIFGR